MTDEELAAIEAQCRLSNRYVAIGDVLALVAEVRRLREALGEAVRFLPEAVGTHGEPCDTGDCDIPDRGLRLLAELREALR